ncbi:ATP-binding protein [Acetatifactor muris]|nr:ATP-binding protein [Acetatifactor muris]MCR2046791.1 ATP-binding protein [Acetatifactor muris]
MFKIDLAMICESHHKDDIEDFTKYRVDNVYGNDRQEKVNLNYIAIILRVADLLHITKDRTPSITRRLINISNPKSVIEWEKQMAVRAVQPKLKRDGEENINKELESDTIEITAYFEGAENAEAYFGLSSYLQYARKELQKCNEIVEKARKKEGTVAYKFPWREIDESRITVIGFETKKLSFTIDQENILQLLVGHTLYNDSSVVVRELVQNAIDAVKLQKRYEHERGKLSNLGLIQVDWNQEKRELSFWDNGTGMTMFDVENYLLKVGASKYRDAAIKKQFPDFSSISHFGIGILTCFMIANDIDIITNSEEQEDVNSINLRKVTGSYLVRRIKKVDVDRRIKEHGTMVKLYVRNDVDMSTLERDLRKWIVIPEIPVYLTMNDEDKIRIGYDSLKEALVKFLNETGRTVDGEKYDVYEETEGNVTIAYAVRHLRYLSDWCLLEIDSMQERKKLQVPVGTCVEGIRVEFTTPGYKDCSILAIANIKNSKYQTNVASVLT